MSQTTENENNRKFGKSYLQRAKGNLRSSKILLKDGEYADSVFLLQQCIEKTLKGYALYSGVLKKSDFEYRGKQGKKQISNDNSIGRGHRLFDIFQKMSFQRKSHLERTYTDTLNEPELYKALNITPEKIAEQKKDLEKQLEILYKIESDAKQWRMSEKQIQEYLMDIEKLNLMMDELYNNFDTNLTKFQKNLGVKLLKIFVSIFQKMTDADTRSLDTQSPKILKIVGNTYRLALISMKISGTLLYLSIMLKAHSTKPRYPDIIHNFNPDDFYTSTLPLIKHLGEIQKASEKCINDIEFYISLREEVN